VLDALDDGVRQNRGLVLGRVDELVAWASMM
jgi:hypothetical protein